MALRIIFIVFVALLFVHTLLRMQLPFLLRMGLKAPTGNVSVQFLGKEWTIPITVFVLLLVLLAMLLNWLWGFLA